MTRRERLERKLERRREWQQSRESKASDCFRLPEYASDWAFITQPGPIPARARINRQIDRGCEHLDVAKHHAQKADGLENQLNRTIFSDDEDAIEKLQAKIDKLTKDQDWMKATNRLIRKNDRAGLAAMGLTETTIDTLFIPDFCGRLGFPSYKLQNNNAEISRAKKRIQEIQKRQRITAKAEESGGVTIVMGATFEGLNGPIAYATVTFAEKPDRDILDDLRAADFRWSNPSWVGNAAKIPESVKALTEEVQS